MTNLHKCDRCGLFNVCWDNRAKSWLCLTNKCGGSGRPREPAAPVEADAFSVLEAWMAQDRHRDWRLSPKADLVSCYLSEWRPAGGRFVTAVGETAIAAVRIAVRDFAWHAREEA